jgi:tripartite-type tricarboxylate transporter receptor subunit TctC
VNNMHKPSSFKKALSILHVFITTALIVYASLSGIVSAQSDDPMVFLTSHGAAGSSGRAAGFMAPRIAEYLKRPVEFKYNQGSSAAIGASPDGNIMLMSTIGIMALHPVLIPGFEMNPLTDLRPVTRVTATPDFLIARSGMGIDTIEDLVAYAAEASEPLSYFHIAPASIHRVEFAAILNEFDITNVVLDESHGNGPVGAIKAIKDGTLDLLVLTSPYSVPMIEEGSAVPILVIHPTRLPLYPEVPTLLEKGVVTMPNGSWAGLFVPAGTSDADVEQVYSAIKYALEDPAIVKQINDLGMEVDLNESPAEFVRYLESETARLKIAVNQYQVTTD